MFANLHSHCAKGSVRDAIADINDMASRIKEMGQTTWSITDHGSLSAQLEAYKVSKKVGLKYIFGVEAYICENINVKVKDYWHIILYAKNETGWLNLKKLVSESHINGYYYKPRIDMNLLKKYSDGIICTTACMGGLIARDDAEEQVELLKRIFNEDLYIEMHTNSLSGQREFNNKARTISERLDIKMIPACDAHYVNQEDAPIHREFVKHGNTSTEYYPTDDFFLHDAIQTVCDLEKQGFSEKEINQWIINQEGLCDKVVEFDLGFGQKHYPHISDNEMEDVRRICLKSWADKKLGTHPSHQEYASQMKEELATLQKAGYLSYLLFISDWVNWAKASGIPIGPGRGSCVGSLTCYLMGITELDPIEYKLLFSRFCHLERISPPDIDVDVSQRDRDKVIQHLKDTYGDNMVYQVRTFSCLAARSSMQKAGSILQIEPEIITAVNKMIGPKDGLDVLPDNTPKGIKKLDWANLKFIAGKLSGVIDHYGTHASAVITFPDDPTNYTSIERQGDMLVAAFDFEELEELGLLKSDILGLETLDVIDSACKNAGIDIRNIDLHDRKTSQLLSEGRTIATFQLESTGMQRICRDIRPQSVFDVVPLVALYRPGPIDSGMLDSFIRRRKGDEEVSYMLPVLEQELHETYGLMVYQEDIIRVVRSVFGYTLGEADMVRRAVGKKKKDVLERLMVEMTERGKQNGIPDNITHDITGAIIKFADYGFNKSHAAAYGLMAYRTAFLKANYPREYYCAALNSVLGNKEKTAAYVDAARHDGIEIYPPDARYGKREWNFINDGIRVGMACINGINKAQFTDVDALDQWLTLNKPSIDVARNLAKVGAFRSFGCNPYEATTIVESWNTNGKEEERILGKIEEWQEKGNEKKVVEWTNKLEEVRKKKETFSLDTDINIGQEQMALMGFTTQNILKELGLEHDTYAYQVVSVRETKTKAGKQMAFLRLMSAKGTTVEAAMFNWPDGLPIVGECIRARLNYTSRGTSIRDYMKIGVKTKGANLCLSL